MIVATASVAVIAAATWAAGTPTGGDIPLSPADSPTQEEPSGPPSHGNVGTPQPDVSTSPGSPLSPGLPGTHSSASDRARGADRAADRARIPQDLPGKRKGADKGRKLGEGNSRRPDLPGLPQVPEGRVAQPGAVVPADPGPAPKLSDSTRVLESPSGDSRRGEGRGQGGGRGHGRTK